MPDPSFTTTQLIEAAASSLGVGGLLAKLIEKVFSRRKEIAEADQANAQSRLLTAQAADIEDKHPSQDQQTLDMVLKALQVLQQANNEREQAAIARDKQAETREGLLRAHIVELEDRIKDLSDQLEVEKRERVALTGQLEEERRERNKLQRMIAHTCPSCETWRGLAATLRADIALG